MNAIVSKKIKALQIKNSLLNTLINGLVAWLLLKSAVAITIKGGEHNYPSDLASSGFLLLFIIGLIVIPIIKKKVVNGDLPQMDWDHRLLSHRILSHFPSNSVLAALSIGLVGLLIVTPFTLGIMYTAQITHMSPLSYAVFKGLWTGALAGLSAKPMVMLGLVNAKG